MHVSTLAAPFGLRPGERPPGEQALMHGLAKGLEELLGAKPVPPAPRIICSCGTGPLGAAGGVAVLVSRAPAPDAAQGPCAQVVRLPVRPRKPIFAGSVSRLTEARVVRL